MTTLFESNAEGQSDAYRNLRDGDWNTSHRAYAEQLWERFKPYAEPAFRDELSRAFHQRFWEMYLGCGLLNAGLVPELKPPRGPDFKIQTCSHVIWIEAVVPMAGTGADAVPAYTDSDFKKVPVERMLLRLRSAIEDKYNKIVRYLKTGIVSADDSIIIAVNGGLIPHSILESDPPRILSALFPVGKRFGVFDRNTMQILNQGFQRRAHLIKQSGSKVSTTLFTSTDYSYLSAVLYSNSDAANHPSVVTDIGTDFTVIHNPFARNPIPRRLLPSGRDYVLEGKHIVCHTRGCAQ